MRLLLDTHVVLWAASAPDRLGALADDLADPHNELVVSAVVTWEVAIKHALGRIDLDTPPLDFVADAMRRLGAEPLSVSHLHAGGVADLPPHHGDPFDRLLVAQAIQENLVLATADSQIAAYDVEVRRL